jgi:uncharacterized protein YkwD
MSSRWCAGLRGIWNVAPLGCRALLVGWLGATLAPLTLAGCRPAAPAPAFGSGLARVPASAQVSQLETAMVARLNHDRKAHGLPALRLDERLSEIARHHSADMRDHHFFEHQSPRTGSVDNRLDAAGYAFITVRENLSEAPDIERGEEGLLNSPPHYANIMSNDVTHVGVGIVGGGVVDPRNLTITQVFARPAENEAPERAERAALQRLDEARRERGHAAARRDRQLMKLAETHLPQIDARDGAASVDAASEAIVRELAGQQGGVLISAQVVPGAAQVAFPGLLLDAPRCAVGLAMQRTTGEHGRPALLVLLLGREDSGRR